MITTNSFESNSLKVTLLSNGFKKKKLADYSIPYVFTDHNFEPELIPFCDKSGTAGILLLRNQGRILAASYELKRLKASKSGALKPIICDFCYTLQAGARIALVTFNLNREKTRTVAYYCCADLACSLHVRGLTEILDFAKSQLREDISIDDRVLRLLKKSAAIFEANGSKELV
jgi:hypothetical protein